MTANEFNTLNLECRSEIIWDLGKILGEMSNEGVMKVLFSLHDFFVEMHFTLDGSEVSNIIAVSRLRA